jgi:hypothetical protein
MLAFMPEQGVEQQGFAQSDLESAAFASAVMVPMAGFASYGVSEFINDLEAPPAADASAAEIELTGGVPSAPSPAETEIGVPANAYAPPAIGFKAEAGIGLGTMALTFIAIAVYARIQHLKTRHATS